MVNRSKKSYGIMIIKWPSGEDLIQFTKTKQFYSKTDSSNNESTAQKIKKKIARYPYCLCLKLRYIIIISWWYISGLVSLIFISFLSSASGTYIYLRDTSTSSELNLQSNLLRKLKKKKKLSFLVNELLSSWRDYIL